MTPSKMESRWNDVKGSERWNAARRVVCKKIRDSVITSSCQVESLSTIHEDQTSYISCIAYIPHLSEKIVTLKMVFLFSLS